jgi:type VI secretion system protein ImpH
MAAEGRRDSASIKDELFEHPARFEFFQAVRLLRKLRSGDFRVAAADPSEELVRFRADISLAFPTAEITDLVAPGEQEPGAVMSVPFMGVASPSSFGSLPTRYVEQLLDEEREKNSAPRDFLDLFNHRIISLFFRAWEKYRLDAQYEADEDRRYYEQAIFSLIGMGTDGLRQRLRLDDRALLSRAGLLARTPMPATSLEGLLESYFDVPVSVEQFRATWYPLELDERNQLGAANSTLGHDFVLGERVKLSQFKFRLLLGPLDWSRYQDFFPDAEGFGALDSLVRLAVTTEFDFETRIELREDEVPPLRLERNPREACRLGWSTWLPRPEDAGDACDAVLRHPDQPLEPARNAN